MGCFRASHPTHTKPPGPAATGRGSVAVACGRVRRVARLSALAAQGPPRTRCAPLLRTLHWQLSSPTREAPWRTAHAALPLRVRDDARGSLSHRSGFLRAASEQRRRPACERGGNPERRLAKQAASPHPWQAGAEHPPSPCSPHRDDTAAAETAKPESTQLRLARRARPGPRDRWTVFLPQRRNQHASSRTRRATGLGASKSRCPTAHCDSRG